MWLIGGWHSIGEPQMYLGTSPGQPGGISTHDDSSGDVNNADIKALKEPWLTIYNTKHLIYFLFDIYGA